MFSVIIPVYNVENTLSECVNSVLSQSYKDFEIILVDDGSTDGSSKLCDDFASKDKRIKAVHKKNGGLSSARNAGMKVITGDYFLFLDSDDYWTYDSFLSDLVEIIEKYDSDVVVFNISSDNSIFANYNRNYEIEEAVSSNGKDEAFKELIINNKLLSSACDKIYKSSLFNNEDFRFVEGVYSEDIDWTARVFISVQKISYLDRYAYYYRPNDSSITHNIKYKNVVDLCNAIKKIIKLSEQITDEDYYEWYMNYCAYQYITFLNVVALFKDRKEIETEIGNMKQYAYLLNYHYNKKVKLCFLFNKFFGYNLTIKILKLFLKFRG